MTYDFRKDGQDSYALALAELRRRYLAERLPGETAKEWSERRKSREIPVENSHHAEACS